MTETYQNKTVKQIEQEFEDLINNNTGYQIAQSGVVSEALISRYKHKTRNISLEQKIETLEAFYHIKD